MWRAAVVVALLRKLHQCLDRCKPRFPVSVLKARNPGRDGRMVALFCRLRRCLEHCKPHSPVYVLKARSHRSDDMCSSLQAVPVPRPLHASRPSLCPQGAQPSVMAWWSPFSARCASASIAALFNPPPFSQARSTAVGTVDSTRACFMAASDNTAFLTITERHAISKGRAHRQQTPQTPSAVRHPSRKPRKH
mmetsp:Transcript_85645/g.164869  ORF Transcript_85645/g.164869 Transcript_85645/m.164869 type:complete len:192 (-) Transcript_85645:155-730(-)